MIVTTNSPCRWCPVLINFLTGFSFKSIMPSVVDDDQHAVLEYVQVFILWP